ncbi:hypothetical protein C8R47DRAFT_1138228 [Mycena vitilis]|nr:hypothetical protein C8R47DRAFT_1138228 [Mycena vitilis]
MPHVPFVTFTHPDAEKIAQLNKATAPGRGQIRSTVRSFQLCSVCKKTPDKAAQLKKCSGCLIAHYCSKECQVSDWPTHKKTCKDGGSPTHLKLVQRLVANDHLMYQIQLFCVLALDLLNTPGNALDSCLVISVNTNMPADPGAYLQAMINGGGPDPNAAHVLHIETMEKQPVASHCTSRVREEYEEHRAILTAAGAGDWPLVMFVFTSEGSTVLEAPYPIDPQAMGEARERRPWTYYSGMSGNVSIPMTEANLREKLNNHILQDKSNQHLLRTKKANTER